jgi:hypothetical protein
MCCRDEETKQDQFKKSADLNLRFFIEANSWLAPRSTILEKSLSKEDRFCGRKKSLNSLICNADV